MHKIITIILAAGTAFLCHSSAFAQTPVDTAGIYGERKDSLEQTVFTASGQGNFLSRGKDIRTEVVTAAGLCKMACCNLAESFENSASVSVGYSDAVTGARQIRLLGQSGIYTQMLDENRPVMRGLAAPFGLNYIPGQWLETIQIAKGVTSVINGVESMTGQINMEHRKPTDEKPLYVQASYMDDTKADLNVISSLQLDDDGKWSTVILGHVDGNMKEIDCNGDGFMDDPRQLQFNLSNRWLYYSPDGTQIRFGVRAISDSRKGGQLSSISDGWRSDVKNTNLGGYLKAGFPLNEDNSANIALIADYTWYKMDGGFAVRRYDANQHSAFANLLYQNQKSDQHHFTLGLSEMYDVYDEFYRQLPGMTLPQTAVSRLSDFGAFGEYTFHSADQTSLSAIVGLRADWYNLDGIRFSPRVTLRWAPSESVVLRANGGRGMRYSNPIVDNLGVLSTGKTLTGTYLDHILEDSWTFGANLSWYPGGSDKTCLSLDYFHTAFSEQMVIDYDGLSMEGISFTPLSAIGGGRSYTDNFQLDFSVEPIPRFTVTLTGRLTDALQTLPSSSGLCVVKPMTSRYKGVLNLQYATNLNKWIFDFTASVNGPSRVWGFMKGYQGMYLDGKTEVYPLLYAQITKRFKGLDIYVGGENLTNYRQPFPIINSDSPFSPSFDASCIWGPLMGIKLYAGIRLTIWKTEKY